MVIVERVEIESPVGRVAGYAREGRLCAVEVGDDGKAAARTEAWLARRFGAVDVVEGDGSGAGAALADYFDGDLTALDRVPVDPGGTAFQHRVWQALRSIPVGETRSYSDIAAAVGSPGAVRAVGSANGANPVGIVIPCHRVVRADGTIGGYAGGLDRKRALLTHEGVTAWSDPVPGALSHIPGG